MNSSPSIELILEAKASDIGGGFLVRRTLPSHRRRMVGPFIFFDHMGPLDFPPGESMNVLPHPHIGLATVTYLFEGEILHRDSVGSVQLIRPGDINWMVAGKGIVHSERSRPEIRQTGQRLHGIQLWVALPEESEDMEPDFFHHPAHTLPGRELSPGVEARVLIGQAWDIQSPVQTYSSMIYAEIRLASQTQWIMESEAEEQAVYIVSGSISVDGESHKSGTMLVFKPGASVHLSAPEFCTIMLLGGSSMEKRKIYWNFVHSSADKIEEAKLRWQNRSFPEIEGETEFVPLPPQR